ncbi:MAG TPA: STAS domain-containing protein [Tepidisphaeraceae bacterium]|nr:STAS domain-containing protein [Tepidisphaeraceae bacterium]
MVGLQREDLDDLIILKLKGILTSEEVREVEEPFVNITDRPGARVVVDLGDVQMVTTPALSMFIAAAHRAKQSGGKLVFTQAKPPVSEILERLRLDAVLTTMPNLREAISQARA